MAEMTPVPVEGTVELVNSGTVTELYDAYREGFSDGIAMARALDPESYSKGYRDAVQDLRISEQARQLNEGAD